MNEAVWGPVKVQGIPGLKENISCDYLIIGGGIAGFLAAYHLQNLGRVVLVEKDTLFSKTTCRTTAWVTPFQGPIYADLIKKYGLKHALGYYESQKASMLAYDRLIKELSIDCAWTSAKSFYYCRKKDAKWTDELAAYQQMGIGYKEVNNTDKVVKAEAMIEFDEPVYQFNPIQFLNQLKIHFTIFENTRIVRVNLAKSLALTIDGYSISAKKIIVATNYPFLKIPGFDFLKLSRAISYVDVVEKNRPIMGQVLGHLDPDYYYRDYENKIIVGGLDHVTGQTPKKSPYQKIHQETFPNSPLITTYETMDAMTYDKIPLIGSVSKHGYIITGFNKWGMTNAWLAGEILQSEMVNKEHPYAYVVRPQRHYLASNIGPFLGLGVRSAAHLAQSFLGVPLKSEQAVGPDQGDVVLLKGRKRAIYKTDKGIIRDFTPRCKHLKCQLIWNPIAQSFECPCHGSRYDTYGRVTYGPAVFNLTEKE